MMRPVMTSSSEVRLVVSVLLSNRCVAEAWGLLQQHATKVNIEELLKHMYETCQEMGLMEDLLKLPFTAIEQECLENFLKSSAGIQNREFLLVYHLQRANYIPALQLNQSINANFANDRDPRLRERAVTRNCLLDQYAKVLPRIQRNLAAERGKPYLLPSSVFREVSRPKPLSTVTKRVNAGNRHTRATFINNVLTKIAEVGMGDELKNSFSQHDSPKGTVPAAPPFPLPDAESSSAFIGTPVIKSSQKSSRWLDTVIHPVPSASAAQAGSSWHSPCRASTSFLASSPLKSNLHGSSSQKSFSRAPELNLLQTPLVVKRAKALATASSGFAGFTPQSILRSSLRTTPLATPSASPGPSVTPPLQAKEPRISFREENSKAEWTAGHHGMVKDAWSESRERPTMFTLQSAEDDGAKMEESSESIPGDSLEAVDASKENSNLSARSDQTTLEYEDAKSPGDFEDDVIFIAAKPAHSSTEELADFQELQEEEDSEMAEEKPFQMDQPDSSELRDETGFVEESNAECLTFPEDGQMVCKAAESAMSGTTSEGETKHQESQISSSEEKDVPSAPKPQRSESLEAASESAFSICDSEDVVSVHSENHLEAAEDDGQFPQEEITVSDNLPKPEEMNVIEDSAVKAQNSAAAPETSPYNEIHPSGNLHDTYDALEQQFDLPDNEDGECETAEGDAELFVSQSNFTLVLEGEEGEAEVGIPTSLDASKTADTITEENPVNTSGDNENQEHVTNSVSTVTTDQESQNVAESLPYVPEPIKAAIAENLLDVIKDTRSKEFTSEVVEESIHGTLGRKVTRLRKAKAPLTALLEAGVQDETSRLEVEYVITPRTRTRRQLKSLSISSTRAQELLEMDKPVVSSLSPRRSARRTKEASETSSLQTKASMQDEKIAVMPVTPRRGRKPKVANLEEAKSSHSDGQTLSASSQSIALTPRRGLRRAQEAASRLLEEANEEIPPAEGGIISSSTPKRTRGRKKGSAGDEEPGQMDTKITKASPSRSAKKLKSIQLDFTAHSVKDEEVQPSDSLLLPVPATRGRRRKISSSEVSESSDLDLSKSSLPQTEFKLPATPRRSARKGAQSLLTGTESLSTQEDKHSGEKMEILSTPRRKPGRVARTKAERTDAHEQTAAEPSEESATPRSTARTGRRGRKRRSILEESPGEEDFPQGPAGSPLLLEDIKPSGQDETSRTLTGNVKRTGSRKAATQQKLYAEENEAFLFSPPIAKLAKKSKGGRADHAAELHLEPDLSSQFVFSPPLLRSRVKNESSISRVATEPELPIKEEEDTKSIESVAKEKPRRGRTAKPNRKQARKTTRKDSWSPPPVELKFISPLGTPVGGPKSKQKETTEPTEKTLRRNKKRLSNFPKQVVSRKML